jgi:hypothetical protein
MEVLAASAASRSAAGEGRPVGRRLGHPLAQRVEHRAHGHVAGHLAGRRRRRGRRRRGTASPSRAGRRRAPADRPGCPSRGEGERVGRGEVAHEERVLVVLARAPHVGERGDAHVDRALGPGHGGSALTGRRGRTGRDTSAWQHYGSAPRSSAGAGGRKRSARSGWPMGAKVERAHPGGNAASGTRGARRVRGRGPRASFAGCRSRSPRARAPPAPRPPVRPRPPARAPHRRRVRRRAARPAVARAARTRRRAAPCPRGRRAARDPGGLAGANASVGTRDSTFVFGQVGAATPR